MSDASIRSAAARKQRRDLIILWVFFLVWIGGSFAAFYIFAIKAFTPLGALISGVLALSGVYYLWRMTRATVDDVKFGVVSLTPSSRPACPGGRFEAVLRFHDRAPELPEIEAELRCVAVTIVRRSSTGVAPLEQLAWSTHKKFPLLNKRADLAFDIPGDAPVTNMPGERPSESGWHRLPMEAGKALQYHRWEVFVTAGVSGVDLERGFPVIVEPVPKRTAPTSKQDPLKPAFVPLPKGPRIVQLAFVVLVVGSFIFSFVSGIDRSETRERQVAAAPAAPAAAPSAAPPAAAPVAAPAAAKPKAPAQVGELVAQTPWTRNTEGWDLPLPAFARTIGIAANGIRSTREKDFERFVFDEILIEMNPAWSHMDFFDVMVTVTYFPADERPTVTLGFISTRLEAVRGTLTADRPAQRLRDLSVTAPLPKGEIGRTEVRLGINAAIRDPASNFGYTHEPSRVLVLQKK